MPSAVLSVRGQRGRWSPVPASKELLVNWGAQPDPDKLQRAGGKAWIKFFWFCFVVFGFVLRERASREGQREDLEGSALTVPSPSWSSNSPETNSYTQQTEPPR